MARVRSSPGLGDQQLNERGQGGTGVLGVEPQPGGLHQALDAFLHQRFEQCFPGREMSVEHAWADPYATS